MRKCGRKAEVQTLSNDGGYDPFQEISSKLPYVDLGRSTPSSTDNQDDLIKT